MDWKKIATTVGEKIPVGRLHPRVLAWLEKHAKDNEPWSVAVSGGSDSAALLLLLWAHFPKKRKILQVLHFDHATRPESAGDAEEVAAVAKQLGVTFISARRAPGGKMSEAALRDDRWNFFREQLKASNARIIFFGHQRDDIAETILMRLARGSGASGLCAPRPVREFPDGVVALRPLLDLSRQELVVVLKNTGAAWREDSSNAKDIYLRNRIRHQVIPAWQQAIGARDLDAGVARSRTMIEDDGDALEDITSSLMRDLPMGEPLSLSRLVGQPRAIVRRALWWWLRQNQLDKNLNAQAFDTLLDALTNAQAGRWSAGPGRWLVLDAIGLSHNTGPVFGESASWGPFTLKPGQNLILPSGAKLAARAIAVDGKLRKELKSGKMDPAQKAFFALPAKTTDLLLHVRSWQPGDKYRPLGAPGRRKLQDLFTDKKTPVRERHQLPVVCSEDGEPLWVPHLPPAHAWRVLAGTKTALELTYRP
jgi:tRNA(Ile)-lysidine synthase